VTGVAGVKSSADHAGRRVYAAEWLAGRPTTRNLLSVDGVRRMREANRENDREPDQPRGHLGEGGLAGV
jgi:hypothetical protein